MRRMSRRVQVTRDSSNPKAQALPFLQHVKLEKARVKSRFLKTGSGVAASVLYSYNI